MATKTASKKSASARKTAAAPKARDTRSEYWENKAKQEKASAGTKASAGKPTKKRSTGAKRASTVKAASKKATTTKRSTSTTRRKVTALPTKSIRQPRYYMVALDKTNGTPIEKGRDYMTLKELAKAETALRHKGARVFKKSMYTASGTLADCPKCR